MSLYVLDAVCRILGIRGHIPQNGGFGSGSGESSFGTGTLMRALAALIATVASLVLWLAVWLAIKLL